MIIGDYNAGLAFHLSAGTIPIYRKKDLQIRSQMFISGDVVPFLNQTRLWYKLQLFFSLQCLSTADSFALQNDTEVKVVYAYNTSSDANGGLRSKHTNRGILDGKHNLILMAISAMQPSSTVMPPTSSEDSGGSTVKPPSYAVFSSPDGFFKLQWTYNNSTLTFKMTCKTTGWCAVGFTTTGDGRNMENYDIAVAGYASGAGYIDVSKYKL